jgi:hypothetical protein
MAATRAGASARHGQLALHGEALGGLTVPGEIGAPVVGAAGDETACEQFDGGRAIIVATSGPRLVG